MRLITRSNLLVCTLLIFLGGCSSTPSKPLSRASTVDSAPKQTVLRTAHAVLGHPYRYGGRHPRQGFDCSGLVYYTHQQAGVTLPRTSHAQFVASTPVARKALQPGDLVFFRITRRKISHVGIYIGDNRFIHAPSSGKQVTTASMSDPYWAKRFVRGGRFY